MEQLLEKIKNIVRSLNEKGIPMPIMQDGATKKPSITYTLLVVAGVLTILSEFKLGQEQLGLNFDQCLQLLSYVGIGYIGRKYQKGDVTIEAKTEEKKDE